MRHKRKLTVIGGAIALGALGILWFVFAPQPLIPPAVRQQVTSTLLLPQHPNVSIDRSSYKYDDRRKLLSFNVVMFDTLAVVSEQPIPESFTDIPQAYDKVVEDMDEYAKFDVDVGTVHLTRPKELGGKQAAVLNSKGTLLFVKPEKDISRDDWKRFFTALNVAK